MAASMKVMPVVNFLRFSGQSFMRRCWKAKVPTANRPVGQIGMFTTQPSVQDVQVQSTEQKPEDDKKIIRPLDHEDYFGVKEMVTLKDLFENRVHLGHTAGTRNQHMTPYIFGSRLGIDIIDIEQTLELLYEALNFTGHIAFRKGIILFVSRHLPMIPDIEKAALECGEYSHCRFWQGGVFANATVQFNAITRLPDLCIFLNTLNSVFRNHIGIADAAKVNIPTIGILDTNCDPRLITYPVPGNDDTPCTQKLYLKLFKNVIQKAKARRRDLEEKGYTIEYN